MKHRANTAGDRAGSDRKSANAARPRKRRQKFPQSAGEGSKTKPSSSPAAHPLDEPPFDLDHCVEIVCEPYSCRVSSREPIVIEELKTTDGTRPTMVVTAGSIIARLGPVAVEPFGSSGVCVRTSVEFEKRNTRPEHCSADDMIAVGVQPPDFITEIAGRT